MFDRLLYLVLSANLFVISAGICGGDPNANTGGCGNCGNTCGQKNNFCPEICNLNECTCATGFSFDPTTNLCIPSNQCPTQCGINEVYSACTNDICSAVNCSQLGNPILCDQPDACESGCVCKAGYLRDNDGNCIIRDSCLSALCPKQNEVFDPCPPPCSPQTCDSIGELFNCPFIPLNPPCQPACRCIDGFFNNSNGDCVPKAECPKCNVSNALFSCVEACDSNCQTNNDTAIEDFNEGNAAFTGAFLSQLFNVNGGKSFVSSPFSVLIPLAQLCLFAQGSTFDQIIAVLNLQNKDQIRSVFPEVLSNIRNQEQIDLLLSATIFGDEDFPLSNDFLEESLQVFGAEPQNVDFQDPEEAADIINAVISNQTRGEITDLVSPSFFDSSTRLVITDAIFFLGNWTKPFDVSRTANKTFFIDNSNSIQIKTMFQMNTFNYVDSSVLNSQIVQLFYMGGNVSCVIVLPKERDGISDLIDKVRDGNEVLDALNEASIQDLRLSIPVIDTTTEIDLSSILQKVNVTSLFDESSDLSGILQYPEPLQVSRAVGKARIQLNEKGTIAAAANAIGVSTTSVILPPPNIIDFTADHPFLYYLFLLDTPIFAGVFAGPQ